MSSVSFWCHFDHLFQEKIVENASRVVNSASLACAGGAMAMVTKAGIKNKIKMVALTWREALAEGVVGCVGGLYSRYFTDLY